MERQRSESSISVHLLGRFEVWRGEELLIDRSWNRRKAAALLKLLALQKGHSLHREQVLDALWPDLDPQAAASNLRKNLHYLRRALLCPSLPVDVVAVSGEVVALSAEVRIDVNEFVTRSQAARTSRTNAYLYKEALALYGGDLLLEDLYEPWTEPLREELRALRLEMLNELSQLHEQRGETDGAAACLEEIVQADPLQEEAHRSLMRLYAQGGSRQRALRQYQKCREILEHDLGVEPSNETQSIRQEIVEGRLRAMPGVHAQLGAAPLDRLASSAFVGREREMEHLRASLEGALSGRGGFVMLAGEPGIGKSRLAEELAVYAQLRGAGVLIGRCYEDEAAAAYWPWVQIIRSYANDRDPAALMAEMGAGSGEIAQVVPEIREHLPRVSTSSIQDPEQARFRLLESICAFFKNASTRRPLLLILDDLQWADKPTLILLQFLAREVSGSRMLVLGACRDMEVDITHPLSQLTATLRSSGLGERHVLAGLSEEEVRKMIAAIGEQDPPAPLVDAIFRHSEGNPFFVRELLKHLLEEEKIRWEDDRLTVDDLSDEQWGIPEGVRDVIRGRVGRLSRDCGRLLSVASAMPGSFSWGLLAVVSGEDEDGLLDLLDEVIDAQLLREAGGGDSGLEYEFTHALIRQTVYQELSRTRRARMHRQIGETIESLSGGNAEPHLAELAHHFFGALPMGDVGKAIEYGRRAAESARSRLAYEEAARLYQMTLNAAGTSNVLSEGDRCELLIALGEAQEAAGNVADARRVFLDASDSARKAIEPEQLARAALGVAGPAVDIEFDEPATRLLDEALKALGDEDSPLKAKVLTRLAMNLYRLNEIDRVDALTRQAVDIARSHADPAALAFALIGRHFVIRDPLTVMEKLATANEIVRLAEEARDLEMAVAGRTMLLLDKLELGDIPGVDHEIETLDEATRQLRKPIHLWRVALVRAMRALLDGRFNDGERLVQEALAVGQGPRQSDTMNFFLAQMFMLRREQGRVRELEPAITRVVDRGSTLTATAHCALSQLHSELGNYAEARDHFERLAASDFAEVSRDANWLVSVILLAQTCAFLADAKRAAILYALLHPYAKINAVLGYGATCSGSTSRYLGLLARTMHRWDDAILHFEDALGSNARMGARPYVARTQQEYAEMLLARGLPVDQNKALALLNQAQASAKELGMNGLVAKLQDLAGQAASEIH